MNSPIPDEIRNDIWHLLLNVYAYQNKSKHILETSPTRYELAAELVAVNALADSITLRVARLADRSKGVRSIKSLTKKSSELSESFLNLVKEFETKAEPVLRQRHTRLAHMKVGELSSYPISPLTNEAVQCIKALVNLFDEFSGEIVQYTLKVGSQEKPLNLRLSVIKGARVTL
ncbi:MAG: hypothetical protein CMI01_01975 [Oceanospirillaceae bacterium]|nr:hypothetical protein [Oceanospirillaceae bacterium]